MFNIRPDLVALLIPILIVLGAFGTAVTSIIVKGCLLYTSDAADE